jgi:hypothetical protein
MLLPPATAACNLSWKVPEKMFLKVPGLQEHWFFLVLTKLLLKWICDGNKWIPNGPNELVLFSTLDS